MASRTKKGLEANKNRELRQPVPPLEKLYEKSGDKEQASKVWTGQKINFGGKVLNRPPAKNRIAKDALFNTGAKRIFDRHTGSGRPLKEAPKKSGAGGHNWGWPGIEIGVELASKEELRQLDRQFNPTAPDADEEPQQWKESEADEEWEGEYGAEFEDMEGMTGWEYSIAGEERAQTWPGYWQGLEGVRTLYGDQLGSDEFTTDEILPHSTWEFGANFMAKEPSGGIGGEEEKRVALKVGGPPQWAEGVPWGHKESERAAFEGVPVIPWGEEPERTSPLTRGISDEERAPASRAALEAGGKLPEQGPLGLEAERLSSGRKEEAPASFINKDIKTVVMREGIAEKIGEGKGQETTREALEMMKQQGQATRFEIGDNISLPSS